MQKLLALAGNNPNESEAISAACKARELLDRYNLSVKDIKGLREEEAVKSYMLHEQSKYQGWELLLFARMAHVFDCVPYTTTSPGRKVLKVVGFKEDVEVFSYLFEYVRKSAKRLASVSLAEAKREEIVNSRKQSYDYVFSFSNGFCTRVVQRVEEERDLRVAKDVSCRDLVVASKAVVRDWVTKNLKFNGKDSIVRTRVGWGYHEGVEAGDKLPLRRGVTGGGLEERRSVA